MEVSFLKCVNAKCACVCVHVRVGNTNISVCVSEGGVGGEEGVVFQYI